MHQKELKITKNLQINNNNELMQFYTDELNHLIQFIFFIILTFALLYLFYVAVKSRRVHKQYDDYAREVLDHHFHLHPCPVKDEYRILKPLKALGLFKVAGTLLKGDRFAWVNLSNSTMGIFMKLHTFFFRPDSAYNLPMLSIDVIFMGGKRIFVIEIIDPAVLGGGYSFTA